MPSQKPWPNRRRGHSSSKKVGRSNSASLTWSAFLARPSRRISRPRRTLSSSCYGDLPALPKVVFGVVDVRDLADLHLRAMTNPAAKGERFIAVADGDYTSFQPVAALLKMQFGPQAKRVSTRTIPNWVLRLIAVFNKAIRQLVAELGHVKRLTNAKAKRVLGWAPRPEAETLIAPVDGLLRLHLIKP